MENMKYGEYQSYYDIILNYLNDKYLYIIYYDI